MPTKSTRKPTPKKIAAKRVTAKTPAAERAAASAMKHGPREDFGKPIDSFFEKQPEPQRSILTELRKLVEAAAPDAQASIKWGMPHYSIDGKMYVALNSHKAHVNLVLAGPPGAYKDPKGLLSGESKLGRHLKVTSLDELPREEVRGWLKTCAHLTRTK